MAEPVVVLQMSAHTAKDLLLLMENSIGQYEARSGEITTDYSKRRAEEKSQQKK
jgi:hypothetical protein